MKNVESLFEQQIKELHRIDIVAGAPIDPINEEFEPSLAENIQELEYVNKELAGLLLKKEELTNLIISQLGHTHEGQHTYEYKTWKVEVKTPCIYSLNKKLYESGEVILPAKFNPIKESVSYSVDKALCEAYLGSAPKKVKDSLIQLIDKKPSKPHVVIKERV